jgi:hypothetical protein
MIPVPETFGKARAAQAGIRADREKQETSLRLKPIKNAAKAEAGRSAVRVPDGAAAASRVEEDPDRHAGMSVDPGGQKAVTDVQARDADHCRLEVAAVAVVTAAVQAKVVDNHRPEHAAAAAVDRSEPRVGGIKAAAVDKAVPDLPKAAVQGARVVAGAVAAAAKSQRGMLGSICFNPKDPV